MGKKRRFQYPNPPSKTFQALIGLQGSCSIDCEFCGRTHFVDHPELDWDVDEYEGYRFGAEEEPEQYIPHNNFESPSIRWGKIEGKQVVVNCQCNALGYYEDLFWKHRFTIARYFKKRILVAQAKMKRELNDLVSPFKDLETFAIEPAEENSRIDDTFLGDDQYIEDDLPF